MYEQAESEFYVIVYIIIGTFFVGVRVFFFGGIIIYVLSYINYVGLTLFIITVAVSNTKIVGFTLLITAVDIWMIRNLRGRKKDGDFPSKDAVIVGLAQAVAVTPGISRSGASIVASMLVGMKQETALRFSFLLYIPVSLGTTMLEVPEIVQDPNFDALMIPYLIAFIAAFIATYFALKALINIMAKGNLAYFSYYCVVVGVLVILFL